MYSVRKLVFYCEFCRKYKLTSFAMGVHEKHCTMNPDRVCRMPGCRKKSCPMCEFAAARQSGWELGIQNETYYPGGGKDLKAEVKEWRARFWDPERVA